MPTESLELTPGQPAPDFTLEDAAGASVALSDFAGRDLILYFYPRDATPGCTKQACGFRDIWDDLSELGAVVVGVSPDEADSHRKFSAEHSLPFRLLCDPNREMMRRYGAYGEKILYGKKSVGVIRSTFWIGADGIIQKRWKRVANAAAHPKQVLKVLREQRAKP